MKKLWIAPFWILTACQADTQSYPLMGKTYVSDMQEGYVGCVWEEYKVKTKKPLGGGLKFKARVCPEDSVRPKFGYKTKFHIINDNELVVSRSPQDPDHPTPKYSHPILKLHKITGSDMQAYMNQFLSETHDKDCVIADNGFGRWQSGFQKETLVARGYEFVSLEDYEGLFIKSIVGGKVEIDREGTFPLDFGILSKKNDHYCGKVSREYGVPNVFRRMGHILFEYDQYFFEVANAIDPGSVEYIE